jgi:hypothetical protein
MYPMPLKTYQPWEFIQLYKMEFVLNVKRYRQVEVVIHLQKITERNTSGTVFT